METRIFDLENALKKDIERKLQQISEKFDNLSLNYSKLDAECTKLKNQVKALTEVKDLTNDMSNLK